MAGFFTATGTTRELGRVGRALRNYAVGSRQVAQYADCWTYYGGSASNVNLSASFAGRFYPFTY
jgi:hypothetical protein